MNLQSISIFLRVVHDGSFSAAGRAVGLSPTAVARHISALEQELGAPLFHRNSRKLGLTEAGCGYHLRIAPLVAAMQEAAAAVSASETSRAGVLRVHCRTTFGTVIVAPALPRFLALHPEIKLTMLLSNEPAVDMVGDRFDIDIQVGAQPDSSRRSRLLARSCSVVCAAPSYLATSTPIVRPEDLVAHNCLIYHYGPGRKPAWTFSDAAGAARSIAVSGSLETDNGVMLQEALRGGAGVAVVPLWAVAQEIARGALVRLLGDHDVRQSGAGTAVHALFHAARPESARVRAFLDFLTGLIVAR